MEVLIIFLLCIPALLVATIQDVKESVNIIKEQRHQRILNKLKDCE